VSLWTVASEVPLAVRDRGLLRHDAGWRVRDGLVFLVEGVEVNEVHERVQ
jgi:hypothetical protein